MHADMKPFVTSCDIFQRTTPQGQTLQAPLVRMPVFDTPFKRVAGDIIGPLASSDQENRFILTTVDYATRFPEAVARPNIKTERVAEALVNICSRVGVPDKILSNRGSNFVSELMGEIGRFLSLRQMNTTPYHPMENRLIKQFNAMLKTMPRRMCVEWPKDWDRYLSPLLFVYREVPQASLGFLPFEFV